MLTVVIAKPVIVFTLYTRPGNTGTNRVYTRPGNTGNRVYNRPGKYY